MSGEEAGADWGCGHRRRRRWDPWRARARDDPKERRRHELETERGQRGGTTGGGKRGRGDGSETAVDAVAVTKISIAASAGAETTRAFAAVDNSLSFRSTEYRYHKQNRARLYNRTRSSYFWDAFDPALDFQGSASHWPARVRQASSLSGRFCTSKEHRRGD